jgi:hypothetical protein
MDDGFTPVVFATLTAKNQTALWKLLEDVSRFIWDCSKRTKVHLKPYIGYEDGKNSHAHLILAVPDYELERWSKTRPRFTAWKSWRYKTLDFQPWKSGHDTFGYVLDKHTPLLPDVVCPGRSRACRSGRCRHTK